MSFQIGS